MLPPRTDLVTDKGSAEPVAACHAPGTSLTQFITAPLATALTGSLVSALAIRRVSSLMLA